MRSCSTNGSPAATLSETAVTARPSIGVPDGGRALTPLANLAIRDLRKPRPKISLVMLSGQADHCSQLLRAATPKRRRGTGSGEFAAQNRLCAAFCVVFSLLPAGEIQFRFYGIFSIEKGAALRDCAARAFAAAATSVTAGQVTPG